MPYVQRDIHGTIIGSFSLPQDYAQEFLEAGHAELLPKVTLKDYDIAIERHLDAVADAAGYYDPLNRIPNIDRACAYAGFANHYQAESQGFVKWRADVWAKVIEIQQAVANNEREAPSIQNLISELPAKE